MNMRFLRRSHQWMLLFCGTFFIYFIISTPFELTKDLFPGNRTLRIPVNSFYNKVEAGSYLLKEFIEKEFISETQYGFRAVQRSRDYGRIDLKVFQGMLPVIGYGVFIYFVRHIIRRVDKLACMLAMKRGGHAPPGMLSYF